MNIASIHSEIVARIQAHADPTVREKLKRTVPGARVVGVPVPALRQIAAETKKTYGWPDVESAADLMDLLCRDQIREEMLVGIFLLGTWGRRVAQLSWQRLQPWVEALDNWETCDQLATNVAGPVVATQLTAGQDGPIMTLLVMTRSDQLWQRRFVLATAVSLNQRGRAYPDVALRLCQPLLNDPAPMVRKAVGWALREACKHDEPAVFRFLLKHRQQMPATVLRQAARKLAPGHQEQLLLDA